MNQINFLPESFRRNRRRRQRRPIEFAVIAGSAAVLVAMWWLMGGPDPTLAQQSDQLDQAFERFDQQHAEQQRLEQERARLTAQLLIARETYQPIQTTQVLARLSDLMPEPMRLVSFELVAERPEPESEAPTQRGARQVVTGSGQNAPAKPREPNVMKIKLAGLAPSDEEVLVLIDRLEQDPVFSSVRLRNSRMTKTKTHHVREFHLDLEIDLDRRFVSPAGRRGGVDAD